MRRLRAVGSQERFLAIGAYHLADGRVEHWSAHRAGAGALFLRIDLDARARGGASLLGEALFAREAGLERLDMQWHGPDGQRARMSCMRLGEELALVDERGGERHEELLSLPRRTVLWPPGTLLRGLTLGWLLRAGGAASSLALEVCQGRWEYAPERLRASERGLEPVTVDGRVRHARRVGAAGVNWWLDAADIALRAERPDGATRLMRYSRVEACAHA